MSNLNYNPELFWAKVDKGPGCWEWTGHVHASGYGRFSASGVPVEAHRVAFELSNGPIPEGMLVDHTCHRRTCVNPSHLRLATYKQNSENRGDPHQNNTSGVRGVTWHARAQKWQASVGHNRQRIHVGTFATLAEASAAVQAKRNELFTHNDMDRTAAK